MDTIGDHGGGDGGQSGLDGRLRIDKWLWYARFFKSRSLAAKVCQGGQVRIDGTIVKKAHYAVQPGNTLTFPQGRHVRVIRVVALGHRRGPAEEASQLYEDLAPPTAETAMPSSPPNPARPKGSGPPKKKDRRQFEKFRGRL